MKDIMQRQIVEDEVDKDRFEEIRNSDEFKLFYNEIRNKLKESEKEFKEGGELIDHDKLFAELLAKYD